MSSCVIVGKFLPCWRGVFSFCCLARIFLSLHCAPVSAGFWAAEQTGPLPAGSSDWEGGERDLQARLLVPVRVARRLGAGKLSSCDAGAPTVEAEPTTAPPAGGRPRGASTGSPTWGEEVPSAHGGVGDGCCQVVVARRRGSRKLGSSGLRCGGRGPPRSPAPQGDALRSGLEPRSPEG